MKGKISPALKIWIVAILIIAGILVFAYNSYRIILKNTADAFNEQQFFLVRESARGIEEFARNIETTLRFAADVLAFGGVDPNPAGTCEIQVALLVELEPVRQTFGRL